MIIHILTHDGSPLGVSMRTLMGDDPKQVGCGGSETALLTLCEAWHNRGDAVVLFNDPREGWESPFEQRALNTFDPDEKRDALIVFRTPNRTIEAVSNCQKVWLSCDQYTHPDYSYAAFSSQIHKIVCISPRHVQYFKEAYNIETAIWIDLPIRVQDYKDKQVEKIKNRFVFSSVPARGLEQFFQMWPRIKQEIPDASLMVTADYRLWGCWVDRSNGDYVAKSLSMVDVAYPGALPRPKYAEEQLKAEIMVYSCTYDELMCLAVAEAQIAGVYTITSNLGALPTTNMHKVIEGDPMNSTVRDLHIEEAIKFLSLPEDEKHRVSEEGRLRAIERFNPDNVLAQWDDRVFNG